MYTNEEKIVTANITEVMQTAYIDYSMSVIISRALPDVRDGLKPVQRRILYAMLREGLLHNRPFDKCAGVVGEVLKNYHPHGDASVYDTFVRMAQKWVMNYPLIDPQGNFGSIDGDPPAAYRYTESRLTSIAEEMLSTLDEETVEFVPNYKESTKEPSVLPAGIPNLLMNGSTGIAVGMTTNIPPHNLGELIDAICAIIENPDISIEKIIDIIPGPDFPTGGSIAGNEGIVQYMKTGRGILRIKGKAHIEELKSNREQIVITEIPYNLNRTNLVTKIAELLASKQLEEVSDLRDESDENTRIVIELKRSELARVVINKLFKLTPLESSFGVILVALDKNLPRQMNIKEIIECYIEHRREVIYRRTKYLLSKANKRAHALEGYKIVLENLNNFIQIIKSADNLENIRLKINDKYQLSKNQINAILDLRLYQLTGLERSKIEIEYLHLQTLITKYKSILSNEYKLLNLIKKELGDIKAKYNNSRKTQLLPEDMSFRMEDIIANEGCIITVTHNGFIKRTGVNAYRSQKRGGKGVIGAGQHDKDFIEHLFTASTHDYIMFFMKNGRVYVKKVYEIHEGSRTGKGRSIANILQLKKNEKIAAMICVHAFQNFFHLVMCTQQGIIKKTNLKDYSNYRKGGLIGIKINKNDRLIGVQLTKGEDELLIVTHQGISIRFRENELRDQGRATQGVKGITLKKKQDYVKTLEVVKPNSTLLIAGENGVGKRTNFDEYRLQARGGIGVIATRNDSNVAGALTVRENDEIMMLTASGQAVRSPVKDIRVIGRSTQGVRLINLSEEDRLVGICKVIKIEDNEA